MAGQILERKNGPDTSHKLINKTATDRCMGKLKTKIRKLIVNMVLELEFWNDISSTNSTNRNVWIYLLYLFELNNR